MSTKSISFRVDHRIYEAYAARAADLGLPTVSDYFKSLGRYDLLIGKPHSVTGELHQQSIEQQSRVDHTIADAYFAGDTVGGTYFERIFKQLLAEMGKEVNATASEIAQKMQSILKKAQNAPKETDATQETDEST